MKILVSISTYGDKNNPFLNRVIDEYLSYSNHAIDIIVNGTIPLDRDDITFVSHQSPKTTAFFHRKEFFEKQNDYDFFIFSENDILIAKETFELYLNYERKLPLNYVLGFLRFENTPEQTKYLIDLWLNVSNYDYMKNDSIVIGDEHFFTVSNPFQSCYILSRQKLKYVIQNSNYLLNGTEFSFETKERASASIFTDWEFGTGILHKVLPKSIDALQKCLIEHLPGNHCNPPGINASTSPETFRKNCATEIQLYTKLNLY